MRCEKNKNEEATEKFAKPIHRTTSSWLLLLESLGISTQVYSGGGRMLTWPCGLPLGIHCRMLNVERLVDCGLGLPEQKFPSFHHLVYRRSFRGTGMPTFPEEALHLGSEPDVFGVLWELRSISSRHQESSHRRRLSIEWRFARQHLKGKHRESEDVCGSILHNWRARDVDELRSERAFDCP
jgi:hypothetical protein